MRNRKNTRKEAVFFRFYNDLYCYCQSIRPHPRLREAPSDRRRTDSTGISPIRCPTSLPATFLRSDCDWSGVSLSSARVFAMIGATHSSQLSAAAPRAEFVPDASVCGCQRTLEIFPLLL